tara:strand:- start:1168 stop:2076 length:909 start_codon:yes stop_codon:yes gene_type:complete
MKSKKIIIGSRGSKLALIYAERAREKLLNFCSEVEIKKIVTDGDLNQKDRLSDIGGKGLFSKKIENNLINNQIDIAVHALKDMPSEEPEGLITNCFLERNDPREVLISKNNNQIINLKTNSVIGTSSLRREYQLKRIRNDLKYKLIRGNVDTRINKLNDGLYDAIILAYAGLKSLNIDKQISQIFSTQEIIPSVGQGVVALQCRKNDRHTLKLLSKINHEKTSISVNAERYFLKVLEGDCETAVGAFAYVENDVVNLNAELFSIDGKQRFYHHSKKDIMLSKELGLEVGGILKKVSKDSYKR